MEGYHINSNDLTQRSYKLQNKYLGTCFFETHMYEKLIDIDVPFIYLFND